MKKNGVPESNIILMMYDDIAGDATNPFPGQVFNKPTAAGVPGVDVYDGCVAEYTGKDVNRDVFLAVLTGDARGRKRVIQRRFNVSVPRARVSETAPTLRERSER